MAKILAITPETVSISMENDVIKDIPISFLDFVPQIGDLVEISVSVNSIVVMKINNESIEKSTVKPAEINDTDDTTTDTSTNTETNIKGKKTKRKWMSLVWFIFWVIIAVGVIPEGKIIWSVFAVILAVVKGIEAYHDLLKPLAEDTVEDTKEDTKE